MLNEQDVKVLATEDHKDNHQVKEATLIKKLNPALNTDGGLDLPPQNDAIRWSFDG